jgi:hypothetical protein
MPDILMPLPSAELEEAFLRVIDVEGKVPAALESLGPVIDRDVIVLDAGRGFLALQLEQYGARVTPFILPASEEAAAELAARAHSADVVVIPWSEMAEPGSRFIADAARLLRPGGRLLIIHDYGRDDVWALRPRDRERLVAWSQRNGPFLGTGFRVRVIHCRWTFASLEQARELLEAGFGALGLELAGRMKRPRLEYNIAIYHRSEPGAGRPSEPGSSG